MILSLEKLSTALSGSVTMQQAGKQQAKKNVYFKPDLQDGECVEFGPELVKGRVSYRLSREPQQSPSEFLNPSSSSSH